MVCTLTGGVTAFFPHHPISRGRGPVVGGRAGLTPTGVLSLPFLCKPCPGGHSESQCFFSGWKPPRVYFPYVQKPRGSEVPYAIPSPPQPTMIGLGALPGSMLGSQSWQRLELRDEETGSDLWCQKTAWLPNPELRSSSLHRGPAVHTLWLRCQPDHLGQC